jgi:bifunctional DNA-binding transcriptional regulator/antitoxin component of YhaV-PrlF toxin-antitoxin module
MRFAENLHRLKRSMRMDATIQVRQRGTITLPAEVRQKYGINDGDVLRLVDLDGIFVLTPMTPMVPELAREIERMRQEAGLSTEELLHSLREQRERYYAENYAGDQNDNTNT